MRYTPLASALLLAGAAALAHAGETAGDLPTNHQAALLTVTVEVIATGGHADTADQATQANEATTTPHAAYADTAGGGTAANLSVPDCPGSRPNPWQWQNVLNTSTGKLVCTRTQGGGNPNNP